ncbi:MAG: uroporphyrinogen decarboxylase family protein [Verrucomicrobiota bacterium]
MFTSRTRYAAAMRLERPDRVPLMCQPALGFVLRQLPELDPIDVWHNHGGAMARGFCEISRRFGFDGVLLPAVGAAALDERTVLRIDRTQPEGPVVHFKNGDSCLYCRNDLPRYTHAVPPERELGDLDPAAVAAQLSYHPPSTRLRMALAPDPAGRVADLTQARALVGPDVSVHGSLYSPEDYLIDLLGADGAMIALLTEPETCRALLAKFAHAVAGHAREQIAAGVDALNVSAPWVGQNFISPELHRDLIAPAQAVLVAAARAGGVPSYCHTCGAIGDRLEAIIDTGFDGVECLDPPPLGNVELADAVRRIGDRAFIKGNIDPVHVLLQGTPAQIRADVIARLEIGMTARGFILSTACAIAPDTPAAHVALLRELVDQYGRY